MATDIDMCEQIQAALLSDEELSAKQLKHMESCRDCKKLLSQVEKMKRDLGSVGVPGIHEGLIKDQVMKSISVSASSRHKFKWTNHIGTAAAAVIILVAALYIKNPADDINKKDKVIVSDSAQNPQETPIKKQKISSLPDISYKTDDHTLNNDTNAKDIPLESDSENLQLPIDVKDDFGENLRSKETPQANDSTNTPFIISEHDSSQDIQYVPQDSYSYTTTSEESDSATESVTEFAPKQSTIEDAADAEIPKVPTEQATADESDVKDAVQNSGSHGAGGGAETDMGDGTVTLYFGHDNSLSVSYDKKNTAADKLIFENIELAPGQENFDENILISNSVLSEVADGLVIKRETLEKCGYDNDMFIQEMKNLTLDSIVSIIQSQNNIFE